MQVGHLSRVDFVLVRRVGRRQVGAFWLSRRTRPAYVETGTNSTGDETPNPPTSGDQASTADQQTGVVGAFHTRRGIGHCCGRGGSSTGSSFTVPWFRIKTPSASFRFVLA